MLLLFRKIGKCEVGKWHVEDSHSHLVDPPWETHHDDCLSREYSRKSDKHEYSGIEKLRDNIGCK